MQYLDFYRNTLNVQENEDMFSYYMKTLTHTIYDWSFLVGWEKVAENVKKKVEALDLMNELIGKENPESKLRTLIQRNPSVIQGLPILFAYRKDLLKLRHEIAPETFEIVDYYFKKPRTGISEEELDKLMNFVCKSGIIELFNGTLITNLKDYVYGVEVGLDSNARKNRGGICMENAVELVIQKMCEKNGWQYAAQAGYNKIKKELGYEVHVNIQDHLFDFAVKSNDKILFIETNFYSGGGGTLKRVCGEFQTLSKFMNNHHEDGKFVWITDGLGWETCKGYLEEAYNDLDFIFNLKMIEKGILNELL